VQELPGADANDPDDPEDRAQRDPGRELARRRLAAAQTRRTRYCSAWGENAEGSWPSEPGRGCHEGHEAYHPKTKRTATRAKKDLTPKKDVAGGMFSAEAVSRVIQMKDE
jgi:hypothetical protein